MNQSCAATGAPPLRPRIDPLWTQSLAQLHQAPLALIGAKAQGWARLHRLGLPVPDGFCITTRAYRALEEEAALPPPLTEAITEAFARLRRDHPEARFAVRSSAQEEDSEETSWAGIFSSFLNIDTPQALLSAVERCYSDLHSPRARAYRQARAQNQTRNQPPAMAVMVQVQIDAELAGILFTRDPVSGDPNRLCINAVTGLGDGLAAGVTDGDHYWLDRSNILVEQRLQKSRPVLPPGRCRALAEEGRRLEQALGMPLDLEFACHKGTVYWLQARPISSLGQGTRFDYQASRYLNQERRRLHQRLEALQHQDVLRAGPGVLSNGNIGELLPSPTPMSFALFRQLFAGPGGAIARGRRVLGYHPDETRCQHLFEQVAGQPYFHLELDAHTYDGATPQPVTEYLAAVAADPARANYPEFGLYQQFLPPDHPRHGASKAFEARMRRHGHHYLSQFRGWVEGYLQDYLAQQRRIDLGQLNEAQLVIQIHQWLTHLRRISCCHFVMAARLGFYFAESLRVQLQTLSDSEAGPLLAELLQALPGSRINEQCFALEALSAGDLSIEAYLAEYGHLAGNELEIAAPRLAESVLKKPAALEAHLAGLDPDSGREAFRQRMGRRKNAEVRLRRLAATLAEPPRRQLWEDYRLARRFLPLRETLKYYYAGEYALVRSALLALARQVKLSGEDIFYLRPEELPLCLKDPRPLHSRIRQRRDEHDLVRRIARQRPLPDVIDGARIDLAARPPQDGDSGSHRGHPIAPGLRRGRVRILQAGDGDLEGLMGRLDPDTILVTRSANLGLAPLLRRVAGLIVEVGGFLAHGACQAREAGIPALVLPDACRLLQDHSEVWIDGTLGILHAVPDESRA